MSWWYIHLCWGVTSNCTISQRGKLVGSRKRLWAERYTLALPCTSRLLGFHMWHSVIPQVQRDCREKRMWISSQLRACLSQTVCQNYLSLPEKDIRKGLCFRCLSLRAVVTSCASLTVIDHEKCFKLARYPLDLYHVLFSIKKIDKGIALPLSLPIALHSPRVQHHCWEPVKDYCSNEDNS